MSNQFWAGTEDSLRALIELEKEVTEMRKAAIGSTDRQAFMFLFDDDDDDENEDDRRLGNHLVERVGETGVIKIAGSLTNAHSGWHKFMAGRVTSYEAISGALDILLEDESVKNITLKISSGGGAVTGLDSLAQKIRKADHQKTINAHTSTMAFSAAYWIASAARTVNATRMAELGSIGTLMVHQSMFRMAEKEGIDFTVFRAGKYKAIGLPYEQLTDEDKAYLQADIEKANSFFLGHVSARRNVMISDKALWAEGRTFFAEDAQAAGLIDRIGDLEDFLPSASGAYSVRSSEMEISAEKLAQIEAGAKPEDVLNETELKQYQAALADPAGDLEPEGDDEGKTAASAKGEGEGGDKPAASASDSERYENLLKDYGRVEARLEARDERIAELEAKITDRQATFDSLMSLGVEALNNRETALNKPRTSPATAEALLGSYADLSTEMAKRFKVGQNSQAMKTGEEAEKASMGIPLHLKPQTK